MSRKPRTKQRRTPPVPDEEDSVGASRLLDEYLKFLKRLLPYIKPALAAASGSAVLGGAFLDRTVSVAMVSILGMLFTVLSEYLARRLPADEHKDHAAGNGEARL